MVFVIMYGKEANVGLRLSSQGCLDSLANLHTLAPEASIEVMEAEEYGRDGRPRYTKIDWTWRAPS